MIPGEERESFLNVLFNFFNEGQNGPFNKLLGAPSISLITWAPCWTNSWAVALPSLLADPVMSATFPSNLLLFGTKMNECQSSWGKKKEKRKSIVCKMESWE